MGSTSRCIVVTGGAGALGTGVVRRLVRDGQHVAALGSPRDEPRLRELAAELGDTFLGLSVDVSRGEGWPAALAAIEAKLGPVTGAALLAGTWQGGKPLHEETDDATWDTLLHANLETVHHSLRALLPGMVERKSGSIVVVGSRAVERPWTSANAAAYAASKTAVVTLAQVVAEEVRESGVRINAVLPSTLDTAANRAAMPDVNPARWVSVDSLAGVLGFLLSDAARDISGAAIPVYGRA